MMREKNHLFLSCNSLDTHSKSSITPSSSEEHAQKIRISHSESSRNLPTSLPSLSLPLLLSVVPFMILLRSVNPRTLLQSRSIMSSSNLRQRSTNNSSRISPSSPPPPPAPHSHSDSPVHSHSHGLTHSHSHGSHTEETAVLSSAFSSLRSPSSLDSGSRITLIGLFSNVGLTALKGVAGYVLASSALLADAAHSGSDLIADVVTLVSYRVGRWKPSEKYPDGYGSESFP